MKVFSWIFADDNGEMPMTQVKDMMAAALDVELGRVYYEDYAEILAAE